MRCAARSMHTLVERLALHAVLAPWPRVTRPCLRPSPQAQLELRGELEAEAEELRALLGQVREGRAAADAARERAAGAVAAVMGSPLGVAVGGAVGTGSDGGPEET